MKPSPAARIVACLVALAALASALPSTGAANQCTTSVPSQVCVDQRVEAPPGVIPPQAYEAANLVLGRYYVYVGVEDCLESAISDACRGVEAGPGSTLGVFGLVYEESNDDGGLQRQKYFNGFRLVPPDRMVLL